jgi:hypothetical protein
VLLLATLVIAKDVYISGLERNFNFKPAHIIQVILLYNALILSYTHTLIHSYTHTLIHIIQEMEINGAMDEMAELDAHMEGGMEGEKGGSSKAAVGIELEQKA